MCSNGKFKDTHTRAWSNGFRCGKIEGEAEAVATIKFLRSVLFESVPDRRAAEKVTEKYDV